MSSDDYYDSLGEDINFGEAPVNIGEEYHAEDIYQENFDNTVQQYMDVWSQVHGFDEDTIEYQQAMIDF